MTIKTIRMLAGVLAAMLALPMAAQAQSQGAYVPGADWQRKTPAEAGFNPQLLKEAIDFAIASEVKNPRDFINEKMREEQEDKDQSGSYAEQDEQSDDCEQ